MAKHEIKGRGDGLIEKMVVVNRMTKVVKGGCIMTFSVPTVAGDGDGRIGMGKSKSKEVPAVVQRTMSQVHRSTIKIPLKSGAIHREIIGRHGAAKVFTRPAKKGSGVKAGGPMRLVFDVIGAHNISTKVYGSTNSHNIVRATLDGLPKLYIPADIVAKRGLIVEDISGANRN